MFKKLSIVLFSALLIVTLAACNPTETISDGDRLREIRDSITFDVTELDGNITIPTIDEEGVTATWASSNPAYLTTNGEVVQPLYYQSDMRVSLTLSLSLNDALITKVYEFTILAEDEPDTIELNTNYTDELSMDFTYTGMSFLDDGVGEVDLVRCVDGDTAFFREGNQTFSVRFLGINTPESTAKFEPWGKPASDYTCDKLENATTLVLQADPAAGRMDSYGTRYLAWVWYDGRLLNLELVEQAYSKASGATDTLYGSLIYQVNLEVQFTDRRVWGEVDPDFDYSLDGVQVTIEGLLENELVTDELDFEGDKVVITGIVTRKLGGAAFIQQGDYGIYLYFRNLSYDLTVGNEVLLSGLNVTYYNENIQLTNYVWDAEHSQVLSTNNKVTPILKTIDQIGVMDTGSLLRVNDLTITSVGSASDTGAFDISLKDSSNRTIEARVDANVATYFTRDMFTVNDTINVVGPLSKYYDTYQLMLTVVTLKSLDYFDDNLVDSYVLTNKVEITAKTTDASNNTILTVAETVGTTTHEFTVIIPLGSSIDPSESLFTIGNNVAIFGQIQDTGDGLVLELLSAQQK
jgi:micrococcal nuclease